MFWLFLGKKEVERVKEETQKGFENVKKDISSVSGCIKHLDSEKNLQKKEIESIKDILSTIQEEVEGLKNVFAIMNEMKSNRVFKTPERLSNKQTAVYPVQTAVQTAVQTPNLEQFSITERAILWILLNSDMKLSYDDLAAMMGKERSTIRGQINAIKQKSESLIEEVIEQNGKKRVFIPENLKEKLLKKTKVRVNSNKKNRKDGKNRVSDY
jgi:prophage DNA circulation protein